MGLDGAVCKSGSDLYGFEYELEGVWPSDGVEGCREWSRRCQFNDPYCGSSRLRCEEEREGSIVSYLYVKVVVMIFGPHFQWLPIGFRWSLGHQDFQKIVIGFFLMGVLVNRWGSLAVSLGNFSQWQATLGFPWYS